MTLAAFLRRVAGEPFAFGRMDCALVIADWWRECHGVDPAAHLRGTYSNTSDVLRGGLLELVRDIARDAGAVRTREPKPGDFAVVRYRDTHFGAIRAASGKWAIKATDGLLLTRDCRVVAAWEI